MSDEIILFVKNSLSYKEKFYYLMDLLITNQYESRLESVVFFLIFYIQTLSGFFSEKVGVLKPNQSKSDKILNVIQKVVRLRELLITEKKYFEISIIMILIYLLLITVYILFLIHKMDIKTNYNKSIMTLNFFIKISYYILFNIFNDIYFTLLCFNYENNFFIENYKCSISEHLGYFIIGTISIIYNIIFTLLIQIFYKDNFYLSGNYYSELLTNYHQYIILNNFLFSIMLSIIKNLTREFFLIVNLVSSVLFFVFYYKHVVYYDNVTNNLCGAFHLSYIWTSVFFIIFYFIDMTEKGLFYLFTLLIVFYLYNNIKTRFINNLFYAVPFHKITNKYYILYYIKTLITIIYSDLTNLEERTLLIGVIQLHILECPIPNCVTKTKEKLYIPNLNEWSDRNKPFLSDKVFLDSFLVNLMEFLTKYSTYTIEILLNFSYFHLMVTGNLCQSIYLFQKAKHLKMNLMEQFAFERLKFAINQKSAEKLKGIGELTDSLENLNMSIYFRYEYLKEKFYDEIFKDLELTSKFWKIYSKTENEEPIDFNNVFGITEKIKICKGNIEKLWKKLFTIYSGINEVFYFYLDYVEQINDDSFLKRELDEISRKLDNISSSNQNILYNLMFKKETGIVIVNGDKGKEGLIEKINHEFENSFKYSLNELKGMNISILMPKIFGKEHTEYMKRYISIGEKRIVDIKEYTIFIKDKFNSLTLVKINIKLFPVLNRSLYFIAMVIPEKMDDLILIDNNFIIQGLSQRLREKIQIDNQNFFEMNEIPFYMICKNFIHFYKVFMKGNKKSLGSNHKSDFKNSNISEQTNTIANSVKKDNEKKKNINNDLNNDDNNNNIEINENIELEYEIIIPYFMIQFNRKNEKFNTIIPTNLNMMNNSIISDESSVVSIDEGEFLLKAAEEKKKIGYNLNNEMNFLEIEEEKSEEESQSNKIFDSEIENNNNDDDNNNNNNEKLTPNKNNDMNTPTPTPGNDNNVTPGNTKNKNNSKIRKSLRKITEKFNEETYFKDRLNIYMKLFTNENFDELEKIMTTDTKGKEAIIFRFNFTFKKYIYNINHIAYIIRCIENKNLNGFSGTEDEGNINGEGKNIHNYINAQSKLNKLNELYIDEKRMMIDNISNFYEYSQINLEFQNKLIENKENIKKYSRVLGSLRNKAGGNLDDENASQTSASGFNSDLSKKNRIFEIRESIIKNQKSLFTFTYIFIIAIIFFSGTVVFTIIFYFIFIDIHDSLLNLDKYHSNYYLLEIRICEIISNLISLRSIFELNFYKDEKFDYSIYTKSQEEYFSRLKYYTNIWYEDAISILSYLEVNINKFVDKPSEIFWNDTSIGDFQDILKLNDSEFYPLAISTTLVNSKSLISSKIFELKNHDYETLSDIIFEFKYTSFWIIENSYDNLLPNTFNLNDLFLNLFKKYNDRKINNVWISVIIYLLFILICLATYLYLLIITNNHMGDGLEKILKISQDQINELIKKIQNFEQFYQKKREESKKIDLALITTSKKDKSSNNNNRSKVSNEKTISMENSINQNNQNNINQTMSSTGFSLDTKKNKKLNLQNKAYIHLAIIFIFCLFLLILTFITTNKVIKANYNILLLQAGILGRFLEASAGTIYAKCFIADCNVSSSLDYISFYNQRLIFKIYQAMEDLHEIYNFYHNYYILDICGAAYDKDTENYTYCQNQELPNSLNNTSDLLDFVLNKVTELVSEATFSLNNNDSYYIKDTFGSTTFSKMEDSFYNYLMPVTNRIDNAIYESMKSLLKEKLFVIVIIIVIFNIGIFIFIIYVKYGFMRTFEYLLSISKCIVKIIPSSMISSNQDLENWLEKLNNDK